MAEMSRGEVCAGAREYFERHGRPADPDAIRVFERVCEQGDATLEEVVAFYRNGTRANANLDPLVAPIEMSDADARNLVAFLRALSRE